MNELALFAGAGGGILGGNLLGWRTICAVEIDAFCRRVLMQRQNDRVLDPFPIWDDIRTFDGRHWKGIVDVVSGGFPCQDISAAGKGIGITGSRSGLWKEMARIIGEVRPKHVFVENSPLLRSRGLFTVLKDLAQLGYDAKWGIISCRDVGGVHLRKRIWIVATNTQILQRNGSKSNSQNSTSQISEFGNSDCSDDASDNRSERRQRFSKKQIFRFTPFPWGEDVRGIEDLRKRSDLPEPVVRRVNDDVANGLDRLRTIGNGQVPRVAATAFKLLKG